MRSSPTSTAPAGCCRGTPAIPAAAILRPRRVPAAARRQRVRWLSQRLFMIAADLGRDSSGQWKVISDRTQAPSGAGYAMQNRRVVSRVMPEIYHQANLHRLTPFFQAMRLALVDAAPSPVEDPRVVVLSPGTHSETAFDQAFVASLLGFPLLEGSDLTVRDGRVWMRVLGKLEEVDVILRRVDSTWMDALELRPELAARGDRAHGMRTPGHRQRAEQPRLRGTGESRSAALPARAVRTAARPVAAAAVGRDLVVRRPGIAEPRAEQSGLPRHPADQPWSRSQRPRAPRLSSRQRELLADKIKAAPHRFVGQEVLHLSSAPTSEEDRLVRRNVVLRSFAVRSGESYTAMLGGLARVTDDTSQQRGRARHRTRTASWPRTSGWSAASRLPLPGLWRAVERARMRASCRRCRHRSRWCRGC